MNSSPNRLLFFDYVRYFVITWVILFHVASSFSGEPEFLSDTDSHPLFAFFKHASFLLLMPSLFYTAGYFALPSLRGHTYAKFLGRKLYRLGLPWLIGVLLLGPLMPYIGYYGNSFAGLQSDSYAGFLTTYFGSAFKSWVLPPAQFTANLNYHEQHFWFLSVLLNFFVLFAAAHAIYRRWWKRGNEQAVAPGERDFFRAFVVGAVAAGGIFAVWVWLGLPQGGTVAGVLFLTPGGLLVHGIPFALGVYANAHGWYSSGRAPGKRTVLYLLGSAIILGGLAAGCYALFGANSPLIPFFGFPAYLLVNFIGVVTLTSLAYHYKNSPERVNARFAANSFIVYLIQYPIVLLFHLPWYGWEMSPFLKFALVAAPSLVACYLLSEYMIRPYPKASTLGLAGLVGALCLWGPPRSPSSRLLLDRIESLNTAVSAGPYQPVMGQPVTHYGREPGPVDLTWQGDRLYFVAGGKLRVLENGQERTLADLPGLTAICARPEGGLAAAEKDKLVYFDDRGNRQGTKTDLPAGALSNLLPDAKGGVYFRVRNEKKGSTLYYRSASGVQKVALSRESLPSSGSGALSQDGQRLFWASGVEIRSFAVAEDGSLRDKGHFAEIFIGDGRYGHARTRPADGDIRGVAVDQKGRVFLASRVGLQVFDSTGQLLGVIQVSAQPPLACALDGAEKVLYVADAGQVFAVPLR